MKKSGVFIITGATGGLGSVLAEVAHSEGFLLALIARSLPDLEKLKTQLSKLNGSKTPISIHAVDLRDEAKVQKEMKAILKIHGDVRALINNAATWMGTTSVKKLNTTEIKDSFDLNFFTAFNATNSLLKVKPNGKRSDLAIVNIGATSSLDAWIEVLPFCLAKGALRDFSRALARDLGPQGVHIAHCVIDGMLNNKRTRGLNSKTSSDRFIKQTSLASDIVRVALQEKSCWTAEWDVRPYNESW